MQNNRHGAQGILNEASNSNLENEFGTSVEEDVVTKILRGGSPQTGTVSDFPSFTHLYLLMNDTDGFFLQAGERQGVTNINSGPSIAH